MGNLNSVDALRELLFTPELGGFVSYVSDEESKLSNGLNYCFVEISCLNGTQYAIHAHGDEALELHQEATKLLKLQVTKLITYRSDHLG